MTENEVYILFGNKKSIDNYITSITNLIDKTPFKDYTVCSYEMSNHKSSKDFIKHQNRYQEFIFIQQQEFELIHHDLCSKARVFMKNIDSIRIQ